MSEDTLDLPRYILYDDKECMILCAGETLGVIAGAIEDRTTTATLKEAHQLLDKLDKKCKDDSRQLAKFGDEIEKFKKEQEKAAAENSQPKAEG